MARLNHGNNCGLNEAWSMKQEAAGAEAGEVSWSYFHEVLEPYPLWGF